MSEQSIQNIVLALLTAGGATFLWTVVRSILAFRNSADMREGKAIANLERWRKDADQRADECMKALRWEREMGAYWSRVAGILQHALDVNGIEMPPMPKRPPDFVASPPDSPEGTL